MLHLKQLARVGTRMDRKVARRTRSVHDIAFLTSIGHRGASILGAVHEKMAPQRRRKDADNIVTPCSCMKQGTTRERARAESGSDSVHAGFAGLVLLACRCWCARCIDAITHAQCLPMRWLANSNPRG